MKSTKWERKKKKEKKRVLEELNPSRSIKLCLRDTGLWYKGHKGGSSPLTDTRERVWSGVFANRYRRYGPGDYPIETTSSTNNGVDSVKFICKILPWSLFVDFKPVINSYVFKNGKPIGGFWGLKRTHPYQQQHLLARSLEFHKAPIPNNNNHQITILCLQRLQSI